MKLNFNYFTNRQKRYSAFHLMQICRIGIPITVLLFTSCDKTIVIRVPADNKWHSVYSVHIPDVSLELQFEKVLDTSKPECRSNREPLTTQVRIIQLKSFQSYDDLPERLDPDVPDIEAIRFRDSGPYDLTSFKSRRLLPVVTGKEILVRNNDPCASINVRGYSRKSN